MCAQITCNRSILRIINFLPKLTVALYKALKQDSPHYVIRKFTSPDILELRPLSVQDAHRERNLLRDAVSCLWNSAQYPMANECTLFGITAWTGSFNNWMLRLVHDARTRYAFLAVIQLCPVAVIASNFLYIQLSADETFVGTIWG